jgi:hypothetical protein
MPPFEMGTSNRKDDLVHPDRAADWMGFNLFDSI